MPSRVLPALALSLLAACAAPPSFAECRTVLERQSVAWNRGDLDAFCADYWRSGQTVFAGADAIHVGWDAMVARYRRTYPDRAAMGRTTFSQLEFTELADDTVVATGRYQLERTEDSPWGRFVVVMRRFDDGWKVVLDYTAAATE